MNGIQVIVIGAGPAGLAASLSALKESAQVLVLEHMNQAGKKLLLTGNGCCNFTNTGVSAAHYYGSPEIISSVLNDCSWQDLQQFFLELGIPSTTEFYRFEDCGYLYPADKKAATVRDVLLAKILSSGARLITGCHISKIGPSAEKLFSVYTDQGCFAADRIIFATGSNAFPVTGSDSSIYPVLKELGIPLNSWLPALCAVKSQDPILRMLSGLRCDAEVQLVDESTGEAFGTPFGEIQFREHYVSGIPVLQLSRFAAIGIRKKHIMMLKLQLISANNKDRILPVRTLDLKLTGTAGFDHCFCCSGGVPGDRIDPETLESRDVPGVYFAGELIDVDGNCGGFNLHFAFASGRLAGRNAAK